MQFYLNVSTLKFNKSFPIREKILHETLNRESTIKNWETLCWRWKIRAVPQKVLRTQICSICAHVLFRTLNSIKLLCVSCGRHSDSKFAFVWTEIRELWRLIRMEFETAIKLMVICFWKIRKYRLHIDFSGRETFWLFGYFLI